MGATIHFHYCMGKLVSWGLLASDGTKCSKCGMEKKSKSANGCCKDDQKQLKVDKDQKLTENSPFVNKLALEVVHVFAPENYFDLPNTTSQDFPRDNAPPLGIVTSLFLLICVFRI
jgi:hypothetical protein